MQNNYDLVWNFIYSVYITYCYETLISNLSEFLIFVSLSANVSKNNLKSVVM